MRARAARAAVLAFLAGAGALSAMIACNAIVGVEEVTLRRSGDGGDTQDEDVAIIESPEVGSPDEPTSVQTALGETHSCALDPRGTVKCWGNGEDGQTGTTGAVDGGVVTIPTPVGGIADAVDIAAGRRHTCVARRSGAVSCWGYNLDGQLGNGETANGRPTPVPVTGLHNATRVAAGGSFSCAVRAGGSVACWGNNRDGQLGRGDTEPSTTPVAVVDLSNVVAIAAGQAHACAVQGDGRVRCWGDGQSGQLGAGTTTSEQKPVEVVSLPPAMTVTAGERFTCALTRANEVYCWGANNLGQLGLGAATANPSPSPSAVAGMTDAVAVWSGRNHTCAVRKNGTVVCWGAGSQGQLGDAQPHTSGGGAQASFVTVSGLRSTMGIGAGGEHSCATTRTNAVLCWGANDRGQLGNDTFQGELAPVAVEGYP